MLGLISFTHSDPLFSAFPDKSIVRRDTPKNLLSSILSGELGCAMISLFEYFDHRDELDLVKSATIRSRRGTMSTLLVSRTGQIREPMEIAITEHTRTTAVYLELILQKLGLDYNLIWSNRRDADSLLKEAEYALVIGDEALKVYGTDLKIIWDIGFQFSLLFSLMPVFSVTVRRKDKRCEKELELLERAIEESPKYYDQCAADACHDLAIPESILKRYFRTIRYDFNNEVNKTMDFLSRYHLAIKGK